MNCPSCGAPHGTGRYCPQCAYDFWGAAAGQPDQTPSTAAPDRTQLTFTGTPGASAPSWWQRRGRRQKASIWTVGIVGALLAYGSLTAPATIIPGESPLGVGGSDATATATPTGSVTDVPSATATPTLAAAASSTAATPAATTPSPAPTRVPTSAPTPVPTPKATPRPTPTPVVGVNGNPWGYNFTQGTYIYAGSVPSAFCNYFNCIASFWDGKGYVMECADKTYSLSGGRSGSCSHHGGNYRPLLKP